MLLSFLTQYAQIINLALLGVIIGWLFQLSRLSRSALIDKFEAQLAAKDATMESLKDRLQSSQTLHDGQIATLERQRMFFERLSSMQGDERVEALKLEYQMRIEELSNKENSIERMISSKSIALEQQRDELRQELEYIQAEKDKVREAADRVFTIDKEALSKFADIASAVAKILIRF